MPKTAEQIVTEIAQEQISAFVRALAHRLETVERHASAGRLYARHLRPLLADALADYLADTDLAEVGEENQNGPPLDT